MLGTRWYTLAIIVMNCRSQKRILEGLGEGGTFDHAELGWWDPPEESVTVVVGRGVVRPGVAPCCCCCCCCFCEGTRVDLGNRELPREMVLFGGLESKI